MLLLLLHDKCQRTGASLATLQTTRRRGEIKRSPADDDDRGRDGVESCSLPAVANVEASVNVWR